jgi:hypothetical protein
MVPKIRSGQILFRNKPNQRSLARNCEHYLNLETIMSSETTTGPTVMAGDVITRPGLYESRGGDIMPIIGWGDGWWVSELNGTRDWYGSDGRQRFRGEHNTNGRWDLARWVAPLPASEVEPETTTSEQLAEIEGQADTVQVREGRWRTRNGEIRNVTPTPEGDERKERWPWFNAQYRETWTSNGRYHFGGDSPLDLVGYLGPIEPQPESQPESDTEPQQVNDWPSVRDLRRELKAVQDKNAKLQTQADELRSEIHYLQRELAVSKEQLTIAAAVSQQLQIELDAAQQVPADLPDLQQLRLRLADMTLDRDQYKDAWNQIFTDQTTIRETTAAETVEAIIEWLQHFRGCNSPSLALLLLEALPHIMRSLTGLNPEEIE